MIVTNGDFGDGVGGDNDGGADGNKDDGDGEEATDDVRRTHDRLPGRKALLFEGGVSGAL